MSIHLTVRVFLVAIALSSCGSQTAEITDPLHCGVGVKATDDKQEGGADIRAETDGKDYKAEANAAISFCKGSRTVTMCVPRGFAERLNEDPQLMKEFIATVGEDAKEGPC